MAMRKGETPAEFGKRMAAAKLAKKNAAAVAVAEEPATKVVIGLDPNDSREPFKPVVVPADDTSNVPANVPGIPCGQPGAASKRHKWALVHNVRVAGYSKTGGAVYERRDQTCANCGTHDAGDGEKPNWSRSLTAAEKAAREGNG